MRCSWANNPELIAYHDNEWGIPVYEDSKLFELLILEGMQAGLSWLTVLKKRENFRRAFSNFQPNLVAQYDEEKISELMENKGIIRHELKIRAAVHNAKQFIKIQEQYGTFSLFIWQYVNHTPIINHWEVEADRPSSTPLSEKISQDLLKQGFKFVGPKIIYSFMQASGMVNDHVSSCCMKERSLH